MIQQNSKTRLSKFWAKIRHDWVSNLRKNLAAFTNLHPHFFTQSFSMVLTLNHVEFFQKLLLFLKIHFFWNDGQTDRQVNNHLFMQVGPLWWIEQTDILFIIFEKFIIYFIFIFWVKKCEMMYRQTDRQTITCVCR